MWDLFKSLLNEKNKSSKCRPGEKETSIWVLSSLLITIWNTL